MTAATKPRVLFLYTGGTLGMLRRDPGPLAPSHVAEDVLPYVRGLEAEVDVQAELLCNLDSSDIGPDHWERMAEAIARRMPEFNGIVVLHGTDTMAWSACALSFMLRGLDRPVVFTGAQRPIAFVRTDARNNLIHAALCATMKIPEVGIYFGRRLYRGNRSTKISIQSYEAFESPTCRPLVEMGVAIRHTATTLPAPAAAMRVASGFERNVVVLQVVPGAGSAILDAAVQTGAKGVVIRGFGAGNVPQKGWPDGIARATRAGVAIVLHSQCLRGVVDLSAYEGGRAALEAGAVGTGAMTLEAATVKLMWLLGQGLGGEWLRAAYGEDVAGEGSAETGETAGERE